MQFGKTVLLCKVCGTWAIAFSFPFLLAQIENSIAKEFKIQPTRANQRIPSGNQELMFICGLSFHITTKLLRFTIRPLTPQVESNLLRMSW